MPRYLVGSAVLADVWGEEEHKSGVQARLAPRKKCCNVCYGMQHRVEGKRCVGCGLAYQPEQFLIVLAAQATNWPEPIPDE